MAKAYPSSIRVAGMGLPGCSKSAGQKRCATGRPRNAQRAIGVGYELVRESLYILEIEHKIVLPYASDDALGLL